MPEGSILDCNPIKSVSITNLDNLDLDGLVVIVGPNSCGKTQFLQDINSAIQGTQRKFIVCKNISMRKPNNFNTFINILKDENYAKTFRDDRNRDMITITSPHFGQGSPGGDIILDRALNSYNSFNQDIILDKNMNGIPFFQNFGKVLSTVLLIPNRLTLINQQPTFDYETANPGNDLQALYMNDDAQRKMEQECITTFGKAVWLDATRGNVLCLRVSDEPNLPTDPQRRSPNIMGQHRTIETEGDGLKSYLGVCISLLLGRRPICLIDEPEICLHPPQAYALGKFIGKFGNKSSQSTLIATHSSYVLRGIIEYAESPKILRLTKIGSEFKGYHVDPDILKNCLKKPITRAETILDGIFSDAVIIVESEGDRVVYESVWEKVQDEFDYDIRFIPVGGLGGIAEIFNFYKILDIPVAIIADIDLLMEKNLLKNIASKLIGIDERTKILSKCTRIRNRINEIPPNITEESVKQKLTKIGLKKLNWRKGHDFTIRKELNKIYNNLKRHKELKNKGVRSYQNFNNISRNLIELLQDFSNFGLFLVPVGELENWIPKNLKDVSKKNKSVWANEAARRIRKIENKNEDIWDFIRFVSKFVDPSK